MSALVDWLPARPLGRGDLDELEARERVDRAVAVRRTETDDGTFALGLQVQVRGVVYLAEFDSDDWTVERFHGPNLWWLREERADRLDAR